MLSFDVVRTIEIALAIYASTTTTSITIVGANCSSWWTQLRSVLNVKCATSAARCAYDLCVSCTPSCKVSSATGAVDYYASVRECNQLYDFMALYNDMSFV